ncbi:MAG: hypothetical protein IH892_19255 [Planctomycetes bacterium]|nr:hypothetical protein [Planctomycetota bacterium]
MNDMNDTIRSALKSEAQLDAIDSNPELPMLTQVAETFRGRFRWVALLAAFSRILFLIIAIIAVVQYFRVTETRELIAYATLFLVSIFATAVIKLLLFMLLIKNSVIREVKRLELQIAKLREELNSTNTMA